MGNRAFAFDALAAPRPEDILSYWDDLLNTFVLPNLVSKAASYTVLISDHHLLVDASAGAVTLTLPRAADCLGSIFLFKRTDTTSNTVKVVPAGSETIEGQTSLTIAGQWSWVMLQSDGTNWYLIGSKLLPAVATKSGSYTLTANDEIIFASGALQLTLPSAAANPGRPYTIKKDNSAARVTIFAAAGDTVEGEPVAVLEQPNESIHINSNGSTNWGVTMSYQPVDLTDVIQLLQRLTGAVRHQTNVLEEGLDVELPEPDDLEGAAYTTDAD